MGVILLFRLHCGFLNNMVKHNYMNEKTPELIVPDRCRMWCPNVLKACEDIDENNRKVDEGIMVAVSDDPERASETLLSEISRRAGTEDINMRTADELAEALRLILSQGAEELEAQTGDIRTDIEAFALGCLGAFTLSGSKDGRRDVTVTVCQSPCIEDGTQSEIAIVTRSLRE